ncbi:MAG: N-acetyl-alpha-D-glucosaminyl L-malate synthase BshA, partial [Bacilli bacterium]
LSSYHPNIAFHAVEVNGYSVFQYPPYDLALASKIAEIVDSEQLDVVHAHYAVPHAACCLLARQMSERHFGIVTTLHGTDITVLGDDRTLLPIIRYGVKGSDWVTAVSENLQKETRERVSASKHVEVTYNFVDCNVYYRKDVGHIKAMLGIQPDEKVIIHISNFRKVKRLHDVVDVFASVHETIKSKLVLVGDGPEFRSVREHVRAKGLCKHVLLLGKQDNVVDLLSISDVKLLLSEKESFGLVLLEAMACGVVPVGTEVGGIPEVITHGVTGYVAPLGDIEQLAGYVRKLLQDEHLMKRMQQEGLKRVQNEFALETIVAQYESIYEKVANLPPQRGEKNEL